MQAQDGLSCKLQTESCRLDSSSHEQDMDRNCSVKRMLAILSCQPDRINKWCWSRKGDLKFSNLQAMLPTHASGSVFPTRPHQQVVLEAQKRSETSLQNTEVSPAIQTGP